MLTADIQKLEPGAAIRLLEVDGTAFGADILRFHSHLVPHTPEEVEAASSYSVSYAGGSWMAGTQAILIGTGEILTEAKSIWWQGKEYRAWPSQIEGMDVNGDGSPAEPSLAVSNIDGRITALCLEFQDMAQAKITLRETMARYLDPRNFPDGNPEADPDQESINTWYIDSKEYEDGETVGFRLSNPGDVGGLRIPARQLTAYCDWCMRGNYRGPECGYTGAAYFDDDDRPTTDPSKDQCSGTLKGCELRFGVNNPLPHGGFPAVSLTR